MKKETKKPDDSVIIVAKTACNAIIEHEKKNGDSSVTGVLINGNIATDSNKNVDIKASYNSRTKEYKLDIMLDGKTSVQNVKEINNKFSDIETSVSVNSHDLYSVNSTKGYFVGNAIFSGGKGR